MGFQKLKHISNTPYMPTKMSFLTRKPAAIKVVEEYAIPPTDDPVISAFYAQLTERERVAHAIAVTKLGTSYDVTRTHGFLKWLKKRDAK